MKKMFALLPLIAAFSLVGCDNEEPERGGEEQESHEGAHFEATQEEAKQRVAQLEADGYEISFKYSSSSNDSEEETAIGTVGVKDGYYWYFSDEDSKSMFHVTSEHVLTVYDWSAEESIFKLDEEVILPEDYYKQAFDGLSTQLYCAFAFDGLEGLSKVGSTTFAGRNATEYKYAASEYGVSVSQKVIIDKATGITLYWGVEGHTIQGESGAASYEVTSFKTGDAVTVPAHE